MFVSNIINGLFGSILLFIICYNARQFHGESTLDLMLRAFLYTAFAYGVVDTVTWALMERDFPGAILCANIANALCLCLLVVMTYLWFCYAVYSIYGVTERRMLVLKHMALLPAALCVLIALSPRTHMMFYITEANAYLHGPYYFICNIFTFGLLFLTSGMALAQRKRELTRAGRRECLVICSFTLLPFLGGLAQTIFFGINAIIPSMALATLMMYLNQQNQRQSLDALTKLNNRWLFDSYMDDKFVVSTPEQPTYLLLMDIDDFKHINDTYGHLTGDKAIALVGESLKSVFANTESFVARYGGDEFAVVAECEDSGIIGAYGEKLNARLAVRTRELGLPFTLSLSVGCALFGSGGINDVASLINAADSAMYAAKRARRGL